MNYNYYKIQEKKSGDSIKYDSTDIEVWSFEDGINDRFKGEEFDYTINDSGGVNLIQRLLRKFFTWLNDIFGIDLEFIDYQTLELIIYGLMGIGALYLLLKFLLRAPLNGVFKKGEPTVEGFNYIEEDISEIDFDSLIADATSKGNYRLATRYLYLKCLKSMASNGIIDWHYDKTNSDYISEITNSEIRGLFKRISYIYDYVWYGEFTVDKTMYDSNMKDFLKLSKK